MKRWGVVIAVGMAAVLGVGLWARARANRNVGPGYSEAAEVGRGTVVLTVSADGVLQPLTTVAVKSYAGGRIDALAVEVGDEVKPGDLIAKIDPTDSLTAYDQAMADLAAAEARLRQAREQAQVQPTLTKAAIGQAEASHNSASKDLQRLREAGHPQARAQARAALDKAEANLKIAEKELARQEELKGKGFVAQSQVDTAVNRRDLARAELRAAQERWDTLDQDLSAELASAEARVAQTKASLDRARAEAVQDRLREADVTSTKAQVARAQAQVDNARTMLDYTTIRAPRAGVILRKFVEEGTIITSGRSSVAQGTDIVSLGDLTKMFVEVSLDEAEVAKIRVRQSASIVVDAFPDQRFRGVVTRISPQALTEQNITTVLVTVQIENPGAQLKPGMTATCEFMVEKAENVLYLPSRAVREVHGDYVVTVARGAGLAEVPVTVGLIGNDRTEIREGLREGDQVVLPSLAPLSEGPGEGMRDRGRRASGMGGFFSGRR